MGRGSLYKSIARSAYKVIPVATKREIGGFPFGFRLVFNDFSGDEIKGCTEIVDRVTDDRGDSLRETFWPSYRDKVTFVARSAILVGAGGINVLLDKSLEPGFKLIDVLVGPFDF